LLINDLLVLEIGQWDGESKDSRGKGKRPEWQVLDQYVGEERENKSGDGGSEVLDEEDALELEDEEVEELVKASEDALYGLTWDSKILLWSHLANEAGSSDSLSSKLSDRDGCEREIESLENISENVDVVGSKDHKY